MNKSWHPQNEAEPEQLYKALANNNPHKSRTGLISRRRQYRDRLIAPKEEGSEFERIVANREVKFLATSWGPRWVSAESVPWSPLKKCAGNAV